MAVLRELALDSQVSVRGEPRPDFPVEPNTSAGRALWLGPDEWLVIDAREEDFPDAAAVIDVSAGEIAAGVGAGVVEDEDLIVLDEDGELEAVDLDVFAFALAEVGQLAERRPRHGQ